MYPDEDERWVLESIAASIPYLAPEERPETLWQPILSLHREADDWVEVFLRDVHQCALRADPTPDGYAPAVRAMVE